MGHLVLLDLRLFDNICDKVEYLISDKSDITDIIDHSFGEIKVTSYNSLPTEKILTCHNAIICIKSVVDKNKDNYYYNVFLEKGLYKVKFCTQYF